MTWLLVLALAFALLIYVWLTLDSRESAKPWSDYSTGQAELAHTDNLPAETAAPAGPPDASEQSTSDTQLAAANNSSKDPTSNPARQASSAERLRQAKKQAHEIEQENQRKLDLLQRTLASDQSETESLARAEVSYLIKRWHQAWQSGQVEPYLAYYSDNFIPGDALPLETWRAQRRARISPSKGIKLRLSNFTVRFDSGYRKSVVEFDQEYRSNDVTDQSRKRLVLSKEGLTWRIISEGDVK